MALDTPENALEIENRMNADITANAPQANPTLRNSLIQANVVAHSNRFLDLYRSLDVAALQTFWDTSSIEFLTRQAGWFNIIRLEPQESTGNLVVTGTPGSLLLFGTEYTDATGIRFKTNTTTTIATNIITPTSISRIGQVATAIFASAHNLFSGIEVIITGAVETEYNGTFEIIVTDEFTFTYVLVGTPSTPATGTILVSSDTGFTTVTSIDKTIDANLLPGAKLIITETVAGIDDNGFIDALGTSGGSDIESVSDFRERFLFRVRNPVAHFNESDIIVKLRKTPGITRVFVERANKDLGTAVVTSITRFGNVATVTLPNHGYDSGLTITITDAVEDDYNVVDSTIIIDDENIFHYIVKNNPTTPATGTINSTLKVALGTVRVFFMRDNDDNPFPNAAEVAAAKDSLLEISPVNTSAFDIIVEAPVANVQDFVFSSISPDTPTMRDAITNQLKSLFSEFTRIGQTMTEQEYESAIFTTIDTINGDRITEFTLTSPTGDIVSAATSIPSLNSVTFS